MSKFVFSLICAIVVICSCNQSPKQRNKVELMVRQDGDSLQIHGIIHPDDSGKVYMNFRRGEIEEMIQKDSMQSITIVFNSGDSLWLSASIMPVDTVGNVRFNQILMPDSTMDGPFGRELEYELKQRGTYNLIIGESLMAGDPWAGVFKLKMKTYNKKKENK